MFVNSSNIVLSDNSSVPLSQRETSLFSFSRANGPGNGMRWDQAKARNTMGVQGLSDYYK